MNVCVVGLGYMGLPTALLLAKAGCDVFGFDIVREKVDNLNQGILPFDESGMDELFTSAKDRFRAFSDLETIPDVDVFLIAVPTPFSKDKTCDLKYVESATESITHLIRPGSLVILESTVRPGTTVDVVRPLLEKSGLKAGQDFSLAYVSEKAIPGNTIIEMVNNDRIIGGIDDKSCERTKELYQKFVKGDIFLTSCTIAETAKLVENAYRDVNIAFANELVRICEPLGIDTWEVIKLANKHPRVDVHLPGPGVGGHCIAVDPWFLVQGADADSSRLVRMARDINDSAPGYVFGLLKKIIAKNNIQSPRIGILGVAYKKNVDDARSTPSEDIISLCGSEGWNVMIHDPYVTDFPHKISKDISDVIRNSDVLVIVTDHDDYRKVDFSGSVVLDTRNMEIKAKEYHVLGARE